MAVKSKNTTCASPRTDIFHSDADRGNLAGILKRDAVVLTSFLVAIVHGDLQQAGPKYLGSGNLGYHVYLFPTSMAIHDPVILCISGV